MVMMILAAAPAVAAGQPASTDAIDEHRGVVVAEIGYARTWDDEGLLGTGTTFMAGVGYRTGYRWTVRAMVSRVPYSVSHETLTIDGRLVFAGIEAVMQSRRSTVRPFWSIGGGLFNDDSVWIYRTPPNPVIPSREDRIEHHYHLLAMTTAGGLDIPVSSRASILVSGRFYGVPRPTHDLAPVLIIQPAIGMAWRW